MPRLDRIEPGSPVRGVYREEKVNGGRNACRQDNQLRCYECLQLAELLTPSTRPAQRAGIPVTRQPRQPATPLGRLHLCGSRGWAREPGLRQDQPAEPHEVRRFGCSRREYEAFGG
jgi:hypothetical protein